jgi:putative transposase
MEYKRTVKLKLPISPDAILPTIQAYTKAYNLVCQKSWKDNDTNGVSLHHKTYKRCRKFLTADLSISARTKALESVKSVKTLQKKENKRAKQKEREPKILNCPQSKQCSIRYNDKTFNICFEKNDVSLQTISGRIKTNFSVLKYYQRYLNWRRRSAELFVRNNMVFLNVVFEKSQDAPFEPNNKFIGVDRGINKIAVTSDKRFFGGSHVKRVAHRYHRMRKQLQGKKHSGKRHLAKLKGKENRFRRDVNHCISKQIVKPLEAGTTLVLEKLKDINQLVKKKRRRTEKDRKERRAFSSWSYFQLEEFIRYKAEFQGIKVDYVDARYTSQKCSRCFHIAKSNRKNQSIFKCVKCGYHLNADLNASFNISQNYQDAIGYPDRGNQQSLCSPPSAA